MQEKLILLRKRNGTTQKQLADLIDITEKQYGAKESGKNKFNGDEMFAIADYYSLKVDDIFLPTTHQNGELKLQKG
ncbi:MAG: helix-turn-helix transcriptional regulator [Clostridia bacterium]|nr:helix-turn-helix transcriptional regulator [Clostridia bacterium]